MLDKVGICVCVRPGFQSEMRTECFYEEDSREKELTGVNVHVGCNPNGSFTYLLCVRAGLHCENGTRPSHCIVTTRACTSNKSFGLYQFSRSICNQRGEMIRYDQRGRQSVQRFILSPAPRKKKRWGLDKQQNG